MRLATVRTGSGDTRAAVQRGETWELLGITDVGALLNSPDMTEILARPMGSQDIDGVALAPVVPMPRKILCCGHNYREHIAEMGRDTPTYPTLFAKFADTLVGAADAIALPESVTKLDWEAELAVVVGTTIRNASRVEAGAAIAGYTVANDVSARDWQNRTPQWLQGKAFDATTPLGPVLVTPDEFDPAVGAKITCSVNGVVHQSGSTDDLVFDTAALLAYISEFTVLRAGDVVLTGTPSGVGAAASPTQFLNVGDIVETAIDGIGTLRNTISASTTYGKDAS